MREHNLDCDCVDCFVAWATDPSKLDNHGHEVVRGEVVEVKEDESNHRAIV